MGSLSLAPGSSRDHPKNPSLHPCPLALCNLQWVQMGSLPESYSPSLVVREPPPGPVGSGSQDPPRPAAHTSCGFSVPPSISKDDPLGEVSVKEVKTKVNSTLTLECECWAVPPPSISWYKDGRVSAGLQTAFDAHLWASPALLRSFQKGPGRT